MKLNKITFFAALLAVITFCSCNREKPYTIAGTLDLPEQIPYGDTIITLPSFEDAPVYLLDLQGELIDSALIHDNTFLFEGKIKASDAYFVQFASQLGQALLVVEPGNIDVTIDRDGITVNGTPSNDCMADLDAAMADLNADTYEHLAMLTDSLRELGEELSDEQQMQLAEEFRTRMVTLIDSAYNANKDNQGAAYAVILRHMDCETSAELEEVLSAYPEKIRENDFILTNLSMMRQYEQMQQGSSLDNLDPSLFAPEEEPIVPQDK